VTAKRLANDKSVCLSSVVCDVRAPYSGGLTFRGYFIFAPYCSLAIRRNTPKITKVVQRDHPLREG